MKYPKLKEVIPAPDHILILKYANGETRQFNVKPYIKGSWFGKLSDERYFRTVHVSTTDNTVEWADGQDIAPHELYELSALFA